jgi:AraC-like DNA-binding protein
LSSLSPGRPVEKTNGIQRSRPKKLAPVSASNGAGRRKPKVALRETPVAMLEVQEARLRQIFERIESGPCCSIHSLALEFNLSSSRLQHLFKRKTGACLGHILTERRLQQATYLLEQTNLRIKEIACTVGYEHTSSFDRAFERRFGYSPLLYRQTKMLAKNRAS